MEVYPCLLLARQEHKGSGTLSAHPLKHVIQKNRVQRLLPHLGHSHAVEGINSCAKILFPEFLCFLDTTANQLVWNDGLVIGTELSFLHHLSTRCPQ